MNLLVLVEDYPNLEGGNSLMFVHTRNLYYNKQPEVRLKVLSFKTDINYIIDGIEVITYQSFKKSDESFDMLISHAANLRHHLKFIVAHGKKFKSLVFFFHGHEVLPMNIAYPEPYSFIKGKSRIKKRAQDAYDKFKFLVWRVVFQRIGDKSYFIFVSQWMHKQFKKWIKLDIEKRAYIIYNTIGEAFETEKYLSVENPTYDCITIRGNLDGSKYCIDVVNNIAKNNPELSFLVVGKGEFFKYNIKAENLVWEDKVLTHSEIISYSKKARCALMPTRTDAQGVMMCELASYGIPVITSDIEVCREVLGDFNNVQFISNENTLINLKPLIDSFNYEYMENKKFYRENTVEKEIRVLQMIRGEN